MSAKKIKRCVIYCRKSHEEGLEQSFNSLDAQRNPASLIFSPKPMSIGNISIQNMRTEDIQGPAWNALR